MTGSGDFAMDVCVGETRLSHDVCSSADELKVAFCEAYWHYVGKPPSNTAKRAFATGKTVTARNGCEYTFSRC